MEVAYLDRGVIPGWRWHTWIEVSYLDEAVDHLSVANSLH